MRCTSGRTARGPVPFRRTVEHLLLIFPLLAAGCGDSRQPASAEFRGPYRPATLAQVYGAVDGVGSLSAVFDVEVSPSGRILASQPTLGEIAVFERDGTPGKTIGRWGEGPGEFKNPGAIRFKQDTLAVLQFGTGIHLLTAEGEFLTRISFSFPPTPPRTFPWAASILLSDGSVACLGPATDNQIVSGEVPQEIWLKASRSGELLDTLLAMPLEGQYATVSLPGGSEVSFTSPASWNDLMTIRADGSELLVVDRSAAATNAAPSVVLYRIDLDGDTVQTRSIRYDPIPLSPEWMDAVSGELSGGRADRVGVPRDRLLGDYREQIRWPDHHPAVTSFVAGADGSLWLRREPVPGDSIRWDILDARLLPVASTYLPETFDLKRVSFGSAWGVHRDELDIPWIWRFDLER